MLACPRRAGARLPLRLSLAQNFPALTGRIVDQANVIRANPHGARNEAQGSRTEVRIQLVVATVSSLEGQEIEPYANALFRTWKLGEENQE